MTLFTGYGNNRRQIAQFFTDGDGKYIHQLPTNQRVNAYSLAKGDDRALAFQHVNLNSYYRQTSQEEREEVKAFLLTDRLLYRPGQAIYIKGVLYNQKGRETQVKTDYRDELLLLDVNGQEVNRLSVRTNEFGSFAAEMVLPTATLNGNFTLRLQQNGTSTNVRVEEYPIKQAYRLGDEVVLTGYARMLNGVSLQNVPVRYTITRQEPGFYWRQRQQKPLVADSVMIDGDGQFRIPLHFLKAENQTEREYVFHIIVAVTDASGETQEANTSVIVSPRAYEIYTEIPGEVLKEDTLKYAFSVQNRQGEEQVVKVRYQLFRIESNQPEERREVKVEEGTLDAGVAHDFSSWKSLPSARYKLVASLPSEDNLEEACRTESTAEFMLYSRSDRRLGTFTPLFCPVTQADFSETSTAKVLFGTSYKDAYVFLDIFCGEQRLESKVLHLSDELTTLEMPYQQAYGEGITLLFFFVKDGEAHSQVVTLNKKYPQRGLKFQWNVFRDKLQPGQQEEWKLTVKDVEGTPVLAEMLALMYDESLDKIYHRSQGLWVSYPRYYYYVGKQMEGQMINALSLYKYLRNQDVPGMLEYDRFMTFFNRWYGQSIRMYSRSLGAPRMKTMGVAAMNDVAVEESAISADFDSAPMAVQTEEAEEDTGGMPLPEAGEALRTNFAETAFFYPQLHTNEQGEVVIAFTIP